MVTMKLGDDDHTFLQLGGITIKVIMLTLKF